MRGYSLFEVKHRGELGIRIGRFDVNEKELDTPSPFAISNIGGGQADVIDLFPTLIFSIQVECHFSSIFIT
jgi:hypothetical protein